MATRFSAARKRSAPRAGEAHGSARQHRVGASTWSAAERQAHADDLDAPRSLIAVTAKSNRSKGDKDPTDWLPPATDYLYLHLYLCTYITNWTVVKTSWGLSVDLAEQGTLRRIAAGCADEDITAELARRTRPPDASPWRVAAGRAPGRQQAR